MNGLDLFSGIGGLTSALMPWVRPVAYCEIDRFCQAVLLSRMADGRLPVAPIWDDVARLGAAQLPPVDIIYGGFPCQDLSCAGNGAGLAGERSGLFFEVERLAREIRPRFVFLENVPAIRTRGADVVVGRLAGLGYDCRWGVLSAFDVGAPHLRERWWLLAHAHGIGHRGHLRGLSGADAAQPESQVEHQDPTHLARRASDDAEILADTSGQGREGEGLPAFRSLDNSLCGRHGVSRGSLCSGRDRPQHASWWTTEPDVGRVADGVSARVDRLRGLGNGVVPAAAREAFRRLMGIQSESGSDT